MFLAPLQPTLLLVHGSDWRMPFLLELMLHSLHYRLIDMLALSGWVFGVSCKL